VAHCVISLILDADEGLVSGCVVHAAYAPCMHDGDPACQVPLHGFNHEDRDAALRMWRIRIHQQRPLIVDDERSLPDPADHVIEDRTFPGPCGAEVIAVINEASDA
jgi:hypothetical protein